MGWQDGRGVLVERPQCAGMMWEELRDNGAAGTRHSRVGGDGGDPEIGGIARDISPVLRGAMRVA